MDDPDSDPGSDAAEPDEAILARVPLLAALDDDERVALAAAAHHRVLAAGETLFREGEPGDGLALVCAGHLEALVDHNGELRRIGELGRGSWVGELSLLTGAPRSASVRAERETDVLWIPRQAFRSLLERHPEVALELATQLAGQLQQRRPATMGPARPDTISVLPLADGLPVGVVVTLLEATMRRWGPVTVLGRDPDPADPGDRGRWAVALDAAERAGGVVVLVAESPEASPAWASFCVRSADRTLALARGGAPPPWLATIDLTGADLVVVGSSLSPSRLGALRRAVAWRATHLVGEGPRLAESVERLARRSTGHALGVVFSGGGARGLAHMGAIAALRDAGAVIDRVGGTSAGAIAAGLVAAGYDVDEMRVALRRELVDHNPFTDVTVPRQSLIKGRKALAMLDRLFGDRAIEDLGLSMFAVSADLAAGSLVVHRHGPLRDAVAASMSLPGFTPPVALDGRLLVDGGLVDNFPVGTMAGDEEGPVVGIDVMRRFPVGGDGDGGHGADPRLPSIVATLARAMVLGGWSRTQANRARADLLADPVVDDIGFFDFDRIDDAVEAGYRATADAIAAHGLPS